MTPRRPLSALLATALALAVAAPAPAALTRQVPAEPTVAEGPPAEESLAVESPAGEAPADRGEPIGDVAPGVPTPADEAEIRRRVERLYENPRNQVAYPGEEARRLPPPSLTLGPGMAALLEIVLYALLAAGAVFLLYLAVQLVSTPRSRRRRLGDDEAPAEPVAPVAAEAAAPPAALPDPEALAGEGRFGEAVHALLLHAVSFLDGLRRSPWPPGATGREMAASVDLAAAPRRHLALLVSAVEHFLFARRPLTEEDWLVCRGAFDELRRAVAAPAAEGVA